MGRPSRYPDEFRREAVQMALATNKSRASVARRLGVNETTLRNWVANELAEQARQANPLSVSQSEFGELRRLRRDPTTNKPGLDTGPAARGVGRAAIAGLWPHGGRATLTVARLPHEACSGLAAVGSV
jgi:transposase